MDKKTIKENVTTLKRILLSIGIYIIIYAGFIYTQNVRLIENAVFTTGEAQSYKNCRHSLIRPCYRPRIYFEAEGKTYKCWGPRIYKEPKDITENEYRLIYRAGKPFISRYHPSKEIDLIRIHRLSIFFAALGFLFALSSFLPFRGYEKQCAKKCYNEEK